MSRRRRWLIPLAAVLAVAAVLLALRWDRVWKLISPPTPGLPNTEEIVQMRAVVWASGSRGHYETGVPEFVVPLPYVERIWRRFDGAEYLRDPQVLKELPLGQIEVTTRSGEVVRVTFFESGMEKLVFTRNGVDFFQSEPRNDQGTHLGGGLSLAGTFRHVWLTSLRN